LLNKNTIFLFEIHLCFRFVFGVVGFSRQMDDAIHRWQLLQPVPPVIASRQLSTSLRIRQLPDMSNL
jgi:hypothetical protein